MTSRPVSVAVIGLGMASAPHLAALRALQAAREVEVVGVYARTPQTRLAVAQAQGWPAFDSLETVIDSRAEVALLLTPPHARQEIVAPLAAAGKAILMEKPIERDLPRATALVATCDAAGVPLGLVLQHRMRPGAQALAALLREGTPGAVQMVRLTLPWWRDQAYYDQPGRGSYAQDGGGVLLTQAIHLLDLMLSLTGPVVGVTALTGTTGAHRMEAENFATAGLRFANGALGAVTATTAAFPGQAEGLVLDCAHASLSLQGGALEVHWRDGRVERMGTQGPSGAGANPMDFPFVHHQAVLSDFIHALRAGRAPAIPGREGLRVHRLIDAIERAAAHGRHIALEPPI